MRLTNRNTVEYAAELQDFLREDLLKWYPEVAGKLKITVCRLLSYILHLFINAVDRGSPACPPWLLRQECYSDRGQSSITLASNMAIDTLYRKCSEKVE